MIQSKSFSRKKATSFSSRLQLRSSTLSLKKSRKTKEMRDFYRFVYENDLRKESLEILNEILLQRKKRAVLKKQTKSPPQSQL